MFFPRASKILALAAALSAAAVSVSLAEKTYPIRSSSGKTVDFSVTGVSPEGVFVKARNQRGQREIRIDWSAIDMDWMRENAAELVKAKEFSEQAAYVRRRNAERLEELRRETDPTAISGTVVAVLKGGALVKSSGIRPTGDVARAMTSRTGLFSGTCFIENVPGIEKLADGDKIELIAYESGTYSYLSMMYREPKTIKKFLARDEGRRGFADRGREDFLDIDKFLDSGTRRAIAPVIPELVKPEMPVATGSGLLIKGGYVATANHVVKGAKRIAVNYGGSWHAASVVSSDEAPDVALLKVEKLRDGIELSISSTPSIGESVFSLGYPNTSVQGKNIKFTSGDISSLAGMRDDPNFIQISVPVQPGNSGGPLFDFCGNLVGLVVSRMSDKAAMDVHGYVPQNVNYATKAEHLERLLKRAGVEVKPASSKRKEKTEAIGDCQPFCVFITAEK